MRTETLRLRSGQAWNLRRAFVVGIVCVVLASLVACRPATRQGQPGHGPTPTPLPTATPPQKSPTATSPVLSSSASPIVNAVEESPTAIPTNELEPSPIPSPEGFARLGVVSYHGPGDPCEVARYLGAEVTFLSIHWSDVEPEPDQWTWERADRILEITDACQIEFAIKLRTEQLDWATQLASPEWAEQGAASHRPSYPPLDLDEYYEFVYQTATYFRERVRYYAIENEVNSPSWWQGSLDDYLALLQVAYGAVHEADPNAYVLNDGPASQTYGLVIAREMYEAGEAEAAIDWINRYYAGRDRQLIGSEEDLKALLADDEAIRTYSMVKGHFSQGDIYDVYQLHFYEDWTLLSTVIDWIRGEMAANGYQKPLHLWETGYAWYHDDTFDPDDQARDAVKMIVTALAEGIEWVVYLPVNSARATREQVEEWRGLYTPDLVPRPAAVAFATLTAHLAGFTTLEQLDLAPGVITYRFETPRGTVYVLWSEADSTVTLPGVSGEVTVTQIEGTMERVDAAVLPVSTSPIFVSVAAR